jgi:hypothetical protein
VRTNGTDLNDTSRCPLGVRCEACGDEAGRLLAVYTCESAIGVMCLTMCPSCGRSAETADESVSASTAARLVLQHAGHLGVTVEDMQTLTTANGLVPWHQPGYRWR